MSIESKRHLLTLVKRESICFSLQQSEVNATGHVTQGNTIEFLSRIVSGHEKFKTLQDFDSFIKSQNNSFTNSSTLNRLINCMIIWFKDLSLPH